MGKGRAGKVADEKRSQDTKGIAGFCYVDIDVLERKGIGQYKAEDGDNFVCILPPPNDPNGEKMYFKEIFIHRNVGVNRRTFLCPKRMENKECPICNYVDKLKAINPEDPVAVKLSVGIRYLFFGIRYLFFVIDTRSVKSSAMGCQWYDAPGQFKQDVVSLSTNRRTGTAIDVSDPDDGKDVVFTRSGKGKGTRYSGFEFEDRKPIPDAWLEGIPDFDDVLKQSAYEELVTELSGSADKDDGIEDEPDGRFSRRQRVEEPPVEEPQRRREATSDSSNEKPPVETPNDATPPRRDASPSRRGGGKEVTSPDASEDKEASNVADRVAARMERMRGGK